MKAFVMAVITTVSSFLTFSTQADFVLVGSEASQVRQNQVADEDGLERIEDNRELQALKRQKQLIPIPRVSGVVVDTRLPGKFRVVRPWTAQFLKDLGSEFHEEFGNGFRVNSATRTVLYQKHLAKRNRNAVVTPGDGRSSHLTGATIDIGKKKLRPEEIRWLRKRLVQLEQENLIEATEEHYQAVFHVMVFKRYIGEQVQVAVR